MLEKALRPADERRGPQAEPDVESSWAEEIERRARRVLSGEAETHDWSEVRKRLEQKHFGGY